MQVFTAKRCAPRITGARFFGIILDVASGLRLRSPQPKDDDLSDDFQDRLDAGARNLLVNCAQCQPGQKVLIITESEGDGYYEQDLGRAIREVADACGLFTELVAVPVSNDVSDPDEALTQKMNAADCTLFLARLGDQIRFRPENSGSTQVISYALDRQMLASPFGVAEYKAFEELKTLINRAVARAREVRVTCPAGTDFRGSPSGFSEHGGDTTRKRFPVSVFAPVPALGFSGRIAQNGFLTGTGSQFYTPWSCELKDTLFVNFEGNRIIGFDGTQTDMDAARAHYEFVGRKYDIDTYFVHSWHAGIHPGCTYEQRAGSNFERWSGGAFGNPRLLHFHTCGAYPPGEISLNVLDPTVRLDGVAVWEDGQLHPDRVTGGADLLNRYPDLRAAFANASHQVGQSMSGRLSYA